MIRINLLPRKPKPLFALWRDGGILAVTVLILVLSWAIVLINMNRVFNARVRELKAIKKQIEDSKLDLKKVEELKAQKAILENKINIIHTLREQQSWPVHVLDDLSIAIPEQVWLDNLNNTGTALRFAGLSPSYNAVSEFMRKLAFSPYFSNIELENIQQSITKGRKFQKFSITCQVHFVPKSPKTNDKQGIGENKKAQKTTKEKKG